MTNIELMRANKRELEYVLEDPKHTLLIKVGDSWLFSSNDNCFNWLHVGEIKAIVMNDAWFHLRKALAEGKQLEFNCATGDYWEDSFKVNKDDTFRARPIFYRVKADFKAGDYVRYDGRPYKVYSVRDDYYGLKAYGADLVIKPSDPLVTKWKPEVGELIVDGFAHVVHFKGFESYRGPYLGDLNEVIVRGNNG